MTDEREDRGSFRFVGPGDGEQEPFDFVKAMEVAHRTGKWTLPFPMYCQVCAKEVRNVRTLPFCRQHRRDFLQRRDRGVLTEELSHQWDDALAVWNDRPDELRQEPGRELFEFGWPEDDWLFFERGYATRMPDWIVVHRETREIRRFINSSREEVLEELLGGSAVPGQEHIAQVWGTEPDELNIHLRMKQMAEYMQGQALQARSVAADIGSLSFPVYGLIDDFMGLKFSSSGYGGGARGFDNAHFTYLGPDEGGVKSGIGLLVETHVRHFRATHGDDVDEPWQARLAAEQVWRRFEPSDERERRFRDRESPNTWLEQLGEEQSSTIEMSLNGFPSEASVLRWSGEHEVLAFVTKNDESIVRIATVGLAKEDLRNLTAHIHVINHRPDVLAKYQLIMDARFDELRRRFPGDAK